MALQIVPRMKIMGVVGGLGPQATVDIMH
ncbi:MAG: hypothetical protein G01um1014106_648, partial [Parcubacteria group bacterium Gr01-1014_106]